MPRTSTPSSSDHTNNGSSRFLLKTAPICPDPKCNKSATASVSRTRGSYGRPYYYCQDGHKREFITWDDHVGIEQGNPPCKCGYLSRREQQAGPIPKAKFRCATRNCNFWKEIIDDDGPLERSTASLEAHTSWQSNFVITPPARYQNAPSDTPTKYRGQDVLTMTQPSLTSDLSSLSISSSTRALSHKAVSDKCSIHGPAKKRLLRSNRCKCGESSQPR